MWWYVALAFLVGSTAPAWATIADSNFRLGTIYVTYASGTASEVTGYIKSEKPAKCLPDRTVKISTRYNGAWVPFGTDTTDANGYFDVFGSAPVSRKFQLFLTSTRVGNVTCTHDVFIGHV